MSPFYRNPAPGLGRDQAASRLSHASGAARWCSLAVLFTSALAACGGGPPESADPPRPVMVQPLLTPQPQQRELNYPGRVEAAEGTRLAFQADGQVQRIHVSEGEAVVRGQVLVELDPTDYEVQLRGAVVAERTAAADLERRRALQAEGILAPAAVEQAQARLAEARAQREAAERQVAHTRLEAPYDGVIGRRQVQVGVVVPAGEPVLTMQDGRVVDVAVEIPESDAARLPFGPGMSARAEVLSVPERPQMPLQYLEHATVPDEDSRTYRLVLRGAPPEGVNLLTGMAMRVWIEDPRQPTLAAGQAEVPVSAVLSDETGDSAIWTVADAGTAHRLPVALITVRGDRAVVAGDFTHGTAVVVAGARMLHEGQQVDPRERR